MKTQNVQRVVGVELRLDQGLRLLLKNMVENVMDHQPKQYLATWKTVQVSTKLDLVLFYN